MSTLFFARALMGISLGFHIIYTAVGIGLPLMLMIVEGLYLRTGDELYRRLARRWIRTAAVLFAIGAVSGTILSFELGFLWPRFMGFAGAIIGLPFALEGFAFFTEAIFVGLYLYGERRLPRWALFLSTIPMTLAAAASAVFVISANGWMNTPVGFDLVNGNLLDVAPWEALANPAWLHEAVHGTLASYVATGLGVAGVYAVALLRGHVTPYNKRGLLLSLAVGSLFLPLMLLTGDYAAQKVAQFQPAKFAAMESVFETTAGAPLHIGGWPDLATGQVKYSLAIPKLLSFLGYRDLEAVVKGLSDFPATARPDPRPVHLFFQGMVGAFFLMLLAIGWFWWQRWRQGEVPLDKLSLWLILIVSPFGFIALESGWLVTEFGRQPWLATNYMQVAEGVTPRTGLEWVFLVFVAVYIALTLGLLWLLLWPAPTQTGQPMTQQEVIDVHP